MRRQDSLVYFGEEAAVQGTAYAAILELHHITIPARPSRVLLLFNELGINVHVGHVWVRKGRRMNARRWRREEGYEERGEEGTKGRQKWRVEGEDEMAWEERRDLFEISSNLTVNEHCDPPVLAVRKGVFQESSLARSQEAAEDSDWDASGSARRPHRNPRIIIERLKIDFPPRGPAASAHPVRIRSGKPQGNQEAASSSNDPAFSPLDAPIRSALWLSSQNENSGAIFEICTSHASHKIGSQ